MNRFGVCLLALVLGWGTIVPVVLGGVVPGAIAQTQDARKQEADRLLELGIEQYNTSQFTAALRSWQQALQLYRELKDRRGEGQSLSNLGSAYSALGNYPKAIEYQEQSLVIAREIQDRRGEGAVLGNLGNAYDSLGNYPKAIEYYQQSLAIAREIQDRRGEGAVLGNLGTTYFALGNYPKAIEYQEQRLAIAREIQGRRGEGNALGNLGLAYFALGNYPKAIEYHQQSLAIFRAIKDRLGEGQSLGNLGLAYSALGNYPKAIEYYQQSLAIAREIQDRLGEGQSLGSLGIAYDSLGNYPKAIEYYQQRLAIAREIQDRLGEGKVLNNLGLARFNAGQLPQAEQDLLAAIAVYESLRDRLTDSQKVSIADTQSQAYNNLQRVLIAQNKVGQALEIAERGRARAFVDLLDQRLRQQPNERLTQVSSLTLAQMQQVARQQNATLVSYANLYNKQLLIWVIKPTGELVFKEVKLDPKQFRLDRLVADARCFGSDSCKQDITEQRVASRGAASEPARQTISFNSEMLDRVNWKITQSFPDLQQLHQLLIEPIAQTLPTDPNAEVIFIPQGSLFLLPFAALQDQQGRYLIDRHTIRVAPSIQVLQLTREQQQRARQAGLKQALVVGNPTMPKVRIKPDDIERPLPSLPGAQREAETIAPLLKTRALVGNQATKAAVKQLMQQSRIIHLATHGKANEQDALNSWIALAPGSQNDGLLTANELLDLKLQAEMVVLSACETGQGKITGDGVIGLSRSFIAAGTPTVVVSLWKVPDGETARLMVQFYQALNGEKNKARALRQAMLKTKADYPDPRDWASFILIGEAE